MVSMVGAKLQEKYLPPRGLNRRLHAAIDIRTGTSFKYGTPCHWAGFYLERATGMSLDEYFQANMFRPLGMTSTSFLSK